MRKYLRVRAELMSKDLAKVTIVEQSHYGREFGSLFPEKDKDFHTTMGFWYENIRLVSTGDYHLGVVPVERYPIRYRNIRGAYMIEVKLSRDQNLSIFNIPTHVWPPLREAIKAYNNHEFPEILYHG